MKGAQKPTGRQLSTAHGSTVRQRDTKFPPWSAKAPVVPPKHGGRTGLGRNARHVGNARHLHGRRHDLRWQLRDALSLDRCARTPREARTMKKSRISRSFAGLSLVVWATIAAGSSQGCKRHFVSPFDKDPGPAPSFAPDGLPTEGDSQPANGADVGPVGTYKGLGGNGSTSPQDDRDAAPVPDPAKGTWPHPRILVTKDGIAKLKARAKEDNPAWEQLKSSCEENVGEKAEAGYEGEDWARAATDLAMCALATDNPRYAKASVRYAVGLLEDAQKLGDGKGGDKQVEHDDGYSIRHRGVAPALVYDWLHENPALTDAAKKKIVGRVYTYGKWYRKAG